MKSNLLLLLFCSLLNLAFSQISFEHHYSEISLNRVDLEISGEKYYGIDSLGKKLNFYNSDHTLWKTVILPMPVTGKWPQIHNVSQTLFNSDGVIEIAFTYTFYSTAVSAWVSHAAIIDENGSIFLEIPEINELKISAFDGLDTKLIATNSSNNGQPTANVYSLPALTLENSYNTSKLTRTNLEYSGEKYYLLEEDSTRINFYNPDHSFWKTINLPYSAPAHYSRIFYVSETAINEDSSIEVIFMYNYYLGGELTSKFRITNEEEVILMEFDDAHHILVDTMEGLPPKLIVYGDWLNQNASRVFSIPYFNLEFSTNAGYIRRRFLLGDSGYKYYYARISQPEILILNLDFSVWRTVNAPDLGQVGYNTVNEDEPYLISQTDIISDDQIEIGYIINSSFTGRIVNESGTFSIDFPGAMSMSLSKIDGLENKILIENYVPLSPGYYTTDYDVYSYDGQMNVLETFQDPASVVIYPNPMDESFQLRLGELSCDVLVITDPNGKIVLETSGDLSSKIDVSTLVDGLYFVEGKKDDQMVFREKIRVY